ncbi:hypothetical protein DFQ28_003936, partial [Apophysomyces sp. BC1034]
MLSPEQRSWFDVHLCPHPERPWSFARHVIIKKYGINDAERQAQRSKDLVNLSMSHGESVDHYTDKFHRICHEAGWENDRKSQTIYINSLLPKLVHHVWLAQVNLPLEQWSNVDHAATITRSLYGKVVLSQHSYEAQNLIAAGPSGAHPGALVSSGASSQWSSLLSASPTCKGKGPEKSLKHCHMHGKGKHSSDECHGMAELLSGKNGQVNKPSGLGVKSSSGSGKPKGKALAIRSASIRKNGTSASDPAPQETVPQATLPLDLDKDVEMEEKSLDNAFYNACTL